MAAYKASLKWHRGDAIEIWQAGADAGNEATISTGIIGSLFDGLMGFLKFMLENLKQRRPELPHYQLLESNSAALLFWGRDLGVSHGELDMGLQHSGLLRDTVLTVLISIGEFMSQGLVRILPTSKEREELLRTSNIITLIENAKIALEAPEEPGQYTHYSTEELCSTLRTKIECLSILSSSLECPAEDEFDSEEARAWVDLQDRPAHQYFVDLIGSRFPHAEKRLVESLGRSNWNRYNHVQKQRENAQDELGVVVTDNKTKSVFHDSGIGSSAPAQSVAADDSIHSPHRTQSEYAATVISSRAEASHKRLPPLPEEARFGEPFNCEVCDRTVKIRQTKEWKKHVFRDICAYTCIFSQCSLAGVLFEDREAMTNHLESQHDINRDSPSQACPLCLEQISGRLDLISLHFARHVEEIALAVLPRSTESEDGSEESENGSEEVENGLEEVENGSEEVENGPVYSPPQLRGIVEDQMTPQSDPQLHPGVNPGVTEPSAPSVPNPAPEPRESNLLSLLNGSDAASQWPSPQPQQTSGPAKPAGTGPKPHHNGCADVKPHLTKEQHDILEAHFQQQHNPSTSTKKGFAESLGVPLNKINTWFQNRRAKVKQDLKHINQYNMQMGIYGPPQIPMVASQFPPPPHAEQPQPQPQMPMSQDLKHINQYNMQMGIYDPPQIPMVASQFLLPPHAEQPQPQPQMPMSQDFFPVTADISPPAVPVPSVEGPLALELGPRMALQQPYYIHHSLRSIPEADRTTSQPNPSHFRRPSLDPGHAQLDESHMQFPGQLGNFNYDDFSDISRSGITHNVPFAPPVPAMPDSPVHEYTPPQGTGPTRRTTEPQPKSYIFANQGPSDFRS